MRTLDVVGVSWLHNDHPLSRSQRCTFRFWFGFGPLSFCNFVVLTRGAVDPLRNSIRTRKVQIATMFDLAFFRAASKSSKCLTRAASICLRFDSTQGQKQKPERLWTTVLSFVFCISSAADNTQFNGKPRSGANYGVFEAQGPSRPDTKIRLEISSTWPRPKGQRLGVTRAMPQEQVCGQPLKRWRHAVWNSSFPT